MRQLPPLYPVLDSSRDSNLSLEIHLLGEAGFPWVGLSGDAQAREEDMKTARAASWANGGWPVIDAPDRPDRIQAGRSLEEAEGLFLAGAEAIALGREILSAPEPSELLWRAQCLRWRYRPPFRRGQGVALIGGSGCGKSTLALELGRHLHLPVEDLDDTIARRAGKSIPSIFSEDGEGAFRAMETEATCEAFQSAAILALGGGAWESEAIRDSARASGYAMLWIAEHPGRIWQRVAQDPARPLAQDRETFLARWRIRMPRWMEAPMVLPLGRTPQQLAEALVGFAAV